MGTGIGGAITADESEGAEPNPLAMRIAAKRRRRAGQTWSDGRADKAPQSPPAARSRTRARYPSLSTSRRSSGIGGEPCESTRSRCSLYTNPGV